MYSGIALFIIRALCARNSEYGDDDEDKGDANRAGDALQHSHRMIQD